MSHRKTTVWVIVLYAISGLPFGMVYDTIPVYLRGQGMSLTAIGLINFVQLAWALKVLWGPLVERFGTPRSWIAMCLSILGAVHLVLAAMARGPHAGQAWLPGLLAVLALAAATQDIAIDGLFVRLMRRSGHDGLGNGLRVSAYRLAMVLGSGGAMMLEPVLGWPWVFVATAAVFFVLGLCVLRAPDEAAERAHPEPFAAWLHAFWRWLSQPGSLGTMAFILLYRVGDAAVAAMSKPFWVDQHVDTLAIGLVNSTVGMVATIAGALAGGWFTGRFGVFTPLWALGLVQAAGALAYAAVSYFELSHTGLYLAGTAEHFTHGLATAALMTFLTRLCEPQAAATQFASLTAVLALMRAVAGVASGMLVEYAGYTTFFCLSFAAALPAYALLPAVRRRLAAAEAQRRVDGAPAV
jgi:PAT family beta-lactamase induction signal transducer AmpG